MEYAFIGIDPGLVHTGVVALRLKPGRRRFSVDFARIEGPNLRPRLADDEPDYGLADIKQFCQAHPNFTIFIEAYRPRSHFDTDSRMKIMTHKIREVLPGSTLLNNTGVSSVVTPSLMKLLGVWKFPLVTNHQDLRAAARIGILGALKSDVGNAAVFQCVTDHLAGNTWLEE